MKLYPAPKYKTFIELKANGKRAIRIHNGKFYVNKKRSRNKYRENRKCVREKLCFYCEKADCR